jgi:hypothetical protein
MILLPKIPSIISPKNVIRVVILPLAAGFRLLADPEPSCQEPVIMVTRDERPVTNCHRQ